MMTLSELQQRAAHIKLVCFDVDGTLTDGRLWFDAQGHDSKAFHAADGQGLKLLQSVGIEVAWITARESQSAKARAIDLGIQHVFTAAKDKLAVMNTLCAQLNITHAQVAYFGDDLPDLPALRAVGFAAIPANAHAWLLPYAHWQSTLHGGEGAARELCDFLLEAGQHKTAILKRWGGE
jgi:3-deoxy-D-manno-octulosonate 8-phosphate phosphatase (KDO 8-P phosphatase)